jgi:molybdopterin biosynthesis enzyme
VKKFVVNNAVAIAENSQGILSVREMKRPRAGIVITGNEVFTGKIKDAFEEVITRKIESLGGEIACVYFAVLCS